MKLTEKFNNEIIKFENAAQKAAEKKAALAAEAYNLEAKIKTPDVYGAGDDVFSIGSVRPGAEAIREQLQTIAEKRAYPLIYDDEYRAAFIEFLETISKDVTQEYYKLAADLYQAERELEKQTAILKMKTAEAEKRLNEFSREYTAITWGIHDKANEDSQRPHHTNDNIVDPVTSYWNPAFNLEYNLRKLEEVSKQRELEKDPEYWKQRRQEEIEIKKAEKASGIRRP